MANNPIGYFSSEELGEAFRAERKALGFTQGNLASKINCRRQTIADIEKGANVELFTLMSALTAIGKGLMIVDRRIDSDQIRDLFNEEN